MSEKKNNSERTALDENNLESVAGGLGHYTVSETDDNNFLVTVFDRRNNSKTPFKVNIDDKLLLKETFNNKADAESFGKLAQQTIDKNY